MIIKSLNEIIREAKVQHDLLLNDLLEKQSEKPPITLTYKQADKLFFALNDLLYVVEHADVKITCHDKDKLNGYL